ncbi:nucleotidyltransferase family protein [Butyricimonas paravirosa]|uniref:nucleotidyltransferase family protein n=1 Tax=Butyricimonas paravirosa TaxID=1472417 RepID=UPI00210EA4B0|nr:nucleotidyltransferase family protein [Butyricimonas paravirosa]MCQ4875165.1 nucleotidyltransferase family protein [Butyricimonas paravirosa]
MRKYIIIESANIKDALIAINNITHDGESLIVVNSDQQMVGSLTDGDIRRGLIAGAELADPVGNIMNRDFKFIKEEEYDVAHLKSFRDRRIMFIPILDEQKHVVDVVNLQKFKSMLPIDAVLMAGGKGERLRPFTEKTPKPLLEVGGKCIIDHNVDRLISYGVQHVNVTVNYLGEQIEEHFAAPRNGVQIHTFREPKFLGTIGSIKFVDAFYNDTVLVMNSDLFTNIDYEDFFLHFQMHDAEMSVAAVPYNISIELGILDLDGRNIKGLIEKPKYNYYANAGIYLIKKRSLAEIPEDTFFHATHLVEKLIAQGKKVIRYPLNGTWIDIGTPQEFERAKELVKHLK